MRIFFLGTNGWYDTDTGNTICTLIDADQYYIILDAGNGIYKADKYISRDKPVYLFLSHFHLDHIEGLHVLTKFRFKKLTIIGQPGTKKTINAFLDKKFSVPLSKLTYDCKAIDVNEGWHDEPFRFQCLKLKHVTKCFGFRFEIEGKAISYCTDTGYCDNAVKLSKNTDLLISECAFLGKPDPFWPHLNPELAAKLAREANVKKLVLTHFDANEYLTMRQREQAESRSRKIFKRTTAAVDGTLIKI